MYAQELQVTCFNVFWDGYHIIICVQHVFLVATRYVYSLHGFTSIVLVRTAYWLDWLDAIIFSDKTNGISLLPASAVLFVVLV